MDEKTKEIVERLRERAVGKKPVPDGKGGFRWEIYHRDTELETAASLIESLSERVGELERGRNEYRERASMLQRKLWAVLKDRRDWTAQAALNAKDDLAWAMENKLNNHLPTIEEVIAAGPYVRVGWNETLDEASERALLSKEEER